MRSPWLSGHAADTTNGALGASPHGVTCQPYQTHTRRTGLRNVRVGEDPQRITNGTAPSTTSTRLGSVILRAHLVAQPGWSGNGRQASTEASYINCQRGERTGLMCLLQDNAER